ncbi:hypothetical protein [Microbacterium sp. SS28]|nr:hypothetical protein [Microbacterium sp. SS28]
MEGSEAARTHPVSEQLGPAGRTHPRSFVRAVEGMLGLDRFALDA